MRLLIFLTLLSLVLPSGADAWKDSSDDKPEKTSKPAKVVAPLQDMVVVPDSDKDGKVSADEKKKALELWGQQDAQDSAAEKALNAQADTDKDGKLSSDEKRKMMEALSESAPSPDPSKKGDKK